MVRTFKYTLNTTHFRHLIEIRRDAFEKYSNGHFANQMSRFNMTVPKD